MQQTCLELLFFQLIVVLVVPLTILSLIWNFFTVNSVDRIRRTGTEESKNWNGVRALLKCFDFIIICQNCSKFPSIYLWVRNRFHLERNGHIFFSSCKETLRCNAYKLENQMTPLSNWEQFFIFLCKSVTTCSKYRFCEGSNEK